MTKPAPAAIAGPTFILNGHSIHVAEAQAYVARIAGEFGIATRVVVSKRGDDLSSLAARAASENGGPIVAGGGDGTVNAIAGKLAGSGIILGVLPMGTLNHFARDVGVPRSLEDAVRNIFTGKIVEVDAGEVNGRIFVNNSGIGFYPHFVRVREEQERVGRVKRVAFMLALHSLVRRYFRLRINVHMGEAEALEHLTPFLFVGNNRYQTRGVTIGTRTKLDSGRLWVCTAPHSGREHFLRIALRTLMGRATDQELSAFETEEIWVRPETVRINVSTDGEVSVMATPLHYRIRPRSLRVVVPVKQSRSEH
jgi:diacylglycerol kinase family enzyme